MILEDILYKKEEGRLKVVWVKNLYIHLYTGNQRDDMSVNLDMTTQQKHDLAKFLREIADMLENPLNETVTISLTPLRSAEG